MNTSNPLLNSKVRNGGQAALVEAPETQPLNEFLSSPVKENIPDIKDISSQIDELLAELRKTTPENFKIVKEKVLERGGELLFKYVLAKAPLPKDYKGDASEYANMSVAEYWMHIQSHWVVKDEAITPEMEIQLYKGFQEISLLFCCLLYSESLEEAGLLYHLAMFLGHTQNVMQIMHFGFMGYQGVPNFKPSGILQFLVNLKGSSTDDILGLASIYENAIESLSRKVEADLNSAAKESLGEKTVPEHNDAFANAIRKVNFNTLLILRAIKDIKLKGFLKPKKVEGSEEIQKDESRGGRNLTIETTVISTIPRYHLINIPNEAVLAQLIEKVVQNKR